MKFRLKEFRKAHGLSQKDVGEWFGLSQPELSRKEAHDIELTSEQMGVLASKFGNEAVSMFVSEELIRNALGHPRRRASQPEEEAPAEEGAPITALAETVKIQSETIRAMQETIKMQAALISKLTTKPKNM